MKKGVSNVGLIVTSVACVALIVGSFVFYGGRGSDEGKVKEEVTKGIFKESPQTSVEPSSPQGQIAPSGDGKVPSSVRRSKTVSDEPTPPPVTESTVSEDEKMAKLWFDLRQEDSDGSGHEELISRIESFLGTGAIPQIVDNFQLQLVTEDDFGFQQSILRTDTKTLDIITMLLPKSVEESKRVVMFLKYPSGDSFKVKVLKDINLVPMDFGKETKGTMTYFYLSGQVINRNLFQPLGTIGLMTVTYNGEDVEVLDLSHLEDSFQDLYTKVRNSVVNLTSKDELVVPFFYNDIINEGEPSDELYLALEGIESTEVYKVSSPSGKVEFSLEETYKE